MPRKSTSMFRVMITSKKVKDKLTKNGIFVPSEKGVRQPPKRLSISLIKQPMIRIGASDWHYLTDPFVCDPKYKK